MKKNVFKLLASLGRFMWLLAAALLLASCSSDVGQEVAEGADGIPGESIRIIATDLSQGAMTRAAYESLTQFYETVVTARGGYATRDNLIYLENGDWKTTTPWIMPTSGTVNAFGISPAVDILSDHLFNRTERYFDYEVPTTDQTVIKFGSKLNFTAQDVKDGLMINFKNATAFLNARATNKLQLKLKDSDEKIPVQVYVKAVTFHNMKSKGRFTYSSTKDTDGSWTLSDEHYADYAQELQEAVLVSNGQTDPDDISDSAMVVLPQSPEKWAWAAKGKEDAGPEDAVSVADANHKCYIELKCQITVTVGDKTYYVWGSKDGTERPQYESIFLPYVARNASPKYATIGTQGIYIVRITETTALDEYGKPIKPKESALGDQFRDAEFINFSTADDEGEDNVDDWEAEQQPEVVRL